MKYTLVHTGKETRAKENKKGTTKSSEQYNKKNQQQAKVNKQAHMLHSLFQPRTHPSVITAC